MSRVRPPAVPPPPDFSREMSATTGSAPRQGEEGCEARRLDEATPLVPRIALQWMEQGGVVAKLFASLDGRITEDNGYILWKKLEPATASPPDPLERGDGPFGCPPPVRHHSCPSPLGGDKRGTGTFGTVFTPPPSRTHRPSPPPSRPRYVRIQVPAVADDGGIPTVWYLSQAQLEEDIIGVRYGYYLLPEDVDIVLDVRVTPGGL